METAVKTTWAIDPTHTEVQFKVKHLVISTVTGFFKMFSGAIESDSEDFDGADVNFSVDINSIDTNQKDRDNHLKSADFFAAEEFPTMDFEGSLKHVSGNDYQLIGDLTVRGVSKKVELKAELGGTMTDPYGNVKSGFEINGKINRKDFGLNWNAVTEAGGIVVSDEVKIQINAQVVKG